MIELTLFRLTQAGYWMGLGVWLGAMLMLAVGAAVTFRTVSAYDPALRAPAWRDLAEPAGAPAGKYPLATRALAGGIVGNMLRALAVIQLVCSIFVLAALACQHAFFAHRLAGGAMGWANLLRVALLLAPMVLLAVDQARLSPAVWKERAIMYDQGQPDAARVAAAERFSRLHTLSERLMGSSMVSLMAALVISAVVLHGPGAADGRRATPPPGTEVQP